MEERSSTGSIDAWRHLQSLGKRYRRCGQPGTDFASISVERSKRGETSRRVTHNHPEGSGRRRPRRCWLWPATVESKEENRDGKRRPGFSTISRRRSMQFVGLRIRCLCQGTVPAAIASSTRLYEDAGGCNLAAGRRDYAGVPSRAAEQKRSMRHPCRDSRSALDYRRGHARNYRCCVNRYGKWARRNWGGKDNETETLPAYIQHRTAGRKRARGDDGTSWLTCTGPQDRRGVGAAVSGAGEPRANDRQEVDAAGVSFFRGIWQRRLLERSIGSPELRPNVCGLVSACQVEYKPSASVREA